MNLSHKLIMLGLAFSLLGSTAAFAKPTPHFENGSRSCETRTAKGHAPNADKDGWPADMILG
jgi:hypothetical protein